MSPSQIQWYLEKLAREAGFQDGGFSPSEAVSLYRWHLIGGDDASTSHMMDLYFQWLESLVEEGLYP